MSAGLGLWLVARREIAARMRTRTFQLSTAALVLIVFGAVFASQWLPEFFDNDEPRRVGVLPAAASLKDPLPVVARTFDEEIEVVDVATSDDLAGTFERENLDAVITEPGQLVFESSESNTLRMIVARAAFEAALPERASVLGLSVSEAVALLQPVPVEVDVLTPEDDEEDAAYAIAFFSSIVLMMAMSLYGQWVLVGVIEEKSNRVVEVLLAVLAPWQLLAGKVIGIMALAVTQIAVTLIALALALWLIDDVPFPEAGAAAITMSALWLVLGLILYNFIYAAVGATATRAEESSSAQTPVLVPLMLTYFAALIYVPNSPDALISRLLSIFPLSAPLVMPVRAAIGNVTAIEMILAIIAMLAAVAGVIWLAGKVYTGAILQTQRLSLLSAFRRAQS